MVSTAAMVTRAAPRGCTIPRIGWECHIRATMPPRILRALRGAVSRTMVFRTTVSRITLSRITGLRAMVLKITLLTGPAIRAAAGRRKLIVGCRPGAHEVAPIATEQAIGMPDRITQRATLRRAGRLPDMAGARRLRTPQGDLPVGITPRRNHPGMSKAADTPAVTVTPVAADTRTAGRIRNNTWQAETPAPLCYR
jgi:hypothetical protein